MNIIVVLVSGIFLVLAILAVRTWSRRPGADELAKNAVIGQFREEVEAARHAGDEADLDRLRDRPRELGLAPEEVEVELELIDGLRDARALARSLAGGDPLPVVTTQHKVVADERCHFLVPVSVSGGPVDRTGKLFLTHRRLVCAAGGPPISVPWHAVRVLAWEGRDLVVHVAGRSAPYRFRCNTFTEAMSAEVVAHTAQQRAASWYN